VNEITNARGEGGITADTADANDTEDNVLTARAFAKADGLHTTAADAKGFVGREGDFDVVSCETSDCMFTFNVNYSYLQEFERDAIEEAVSAFTHVSLFLGDRVVVPEGVIVELLDSTSETFQVAFVDAGALIETFGGGGVLSLTFQLEAQKQYRLGAGVQTGHTANSTLAPPPVPEPTTLALFGLGITVLSSVRCPRASRRQAATR
jgi:hypothetical protein